MEVGTKVSFPCAGRVHTGTVTGRDGEYVLVKRDPAHGKDGRIKRLLPAVLTAAVKPPVARAVRAATKPPADKPRSAQKKKRTRR